MDIYSAIAHICPIKHTSAQVSVRHRHEMKCSRAFASMSLESNSNTLLASSSPDPCVPSSPCSCPQKLQSSPTTTFTHYFVSWQRESVKRWREVMEGMPKRGSIGGRRSMEDVLFLERLHHCLLPPSHLLSAPLISSPAAACKHSWQHTQPHTHSHIWLSSVGSRSEHTQARTHSPSHDVCRTSEGSVSGAHTMRLSST